jgi:hypothetical protein
MIIGESRAAIWLLSARSLSWGSSVDTGAHTDDDRRRRKHDRGDAGWGPPDGCGFVASGLTHADIGI